MKEEKLEEAKRLYGSANADQKYVLETLFPELAGSEDEKVRKEIVEYLKKNLRLEWATWLEKQGECHISHDDEIMIKQLTEYFTTGHGLQNTNETVVEWLNDVKEKLEKQGEQKKSYDTCDSSMMDNKKSPYGEKRDFGYFEEKPADKVEPKFKKE